MGAHALGAVAYAATAAAWLSRERSEVLEEEIAGSLGELHPEARVALPTLAALGADSAGPLVRACSRSEHWGSLIRRLESELIPREEPGWW